MYRCKDNNVPICLYCSFDKDYCHLNDIVVFFEVAEKYRRLNMGFIFNTMNKFIISQYDLTVHRKAIEIVCPQFLEKFDKISLLG